MKNILSDAGQWLAILTIALFANNAKGQAAKDTAKAKTRTVTFTVTEMGCRTDSKMVETALYRKPGVKQVKVEGETVVITYNPAKVKPEELKAIIENTGTCEDPDAKVHKVKFKS